MREQAEQKEKEAKEAKAKGEAQKKDVEITWGIYVDSVKEMDAGVHAIHICLPDVIWCRGWLPTSSCCAHAHGHARAHLCAGCYTETSILNPRTHAPTQIHPI